VRLKIDLDSRIGCAPRQAASGEIEPVTRRAQPAPSTNRDDVSIPVDKLFPKAERCAIDGPRSYV
jgi:hypothetical protein